VTRAEVPLLRRFSLADRLSLAFVIVYRLSILQEK
jgi:hypothetical protein